MELLRLWFIFNILSAVQASAVPVHHVHEHRYLHTSVYWIHCKYLKHRQLYYQNSTATFQFQLLRSGDINPNPGPTPEYAVRDHGVRKQFASYNRTNERIVYDRDFLLQCNPAWRHYSPEVVTNRLSNIAHKTCKNRDLLHEKVWHRIKELDIQTRLRGKRGGEKKDSKTRYLRKERGRNMANLKSVTYVDNSLVRLNCNVCLWNAHSIRNKTTNVTEYVNEYDIDVMCITETWLNTQDDVVIGECTPIGYTFINSPRNASTRGGGIGVLHKSVLKLMIKNSDLSFSTFEYVHVTDLSSSIHFFIVYRPPPSSANRFTSSDFLREFDEYVCEISLCPGKLVLLGDFNVHWDDMSKNDVLHMRNTITSAGFIQHVQGPTHNLGHTLDLVFTRDDSVILDCRTIDTCISDHHMICFVLAHQKSEPVSITSSLRNYRKIDKAQFANALDDLVSSQPEGIEHVSLFGWYVSGVTKVLDTYAPSSTKSRPLKLRRPWFNESVLAARQHRRKAERKWRKTRSDSDRTLYKEANKNVCHIIDTAKEDFLKDKLGSCSVKEVYEIIHSLLNKRLNQLPLYDSASRLANQFSSFFVNKIKRIRVELDACNGPVNTGTLFNDTENQNIPLFADFQLLTQSDVSRIIMSSATKSCRLDPIPTWLLKENIVHILPLLTNVVNQSLSTGIFPNDAHSAIIKPFLKKPGLDQNNLSNYRPVSNLTFLGKLIEKAACTQLVHHIESNNLFDSLQSAYRSSHSTESALIKVKNDIMFSIDSNNVVFMALLDLSAAFDTIDHQIFISRLFNRIGVRSTVLSWFQSYLSGWSSQVDIDGILSNPTTLEFGLPQGSIVGPIGYSIYTLPIGDIIRYHRLHYHLYADDIQLYISFDPKTPGALDSALAKLQNCISDIRQWMVVNKLKLNDSKTEFFVAASAYNLRSIPNVHLDVGGTLISPSDTIRNLGVIFDSCMSMSHHISHICSTVTFYLRNISRIRRFIDKSACHNAVRSLVLSRIDYCNGLLSTIPSNQLIRVQRLQNWAARLIFQVSRDYPSQPLLKSLHWLPLKQRIIFKLLVFVYRSLNNQAPEYLSNCLNLYTPTRALRSASDPLRLTYSITRTLAGDRTFTVSASKYWNDLPLTIRQSSSTSIFRRALKTHLFRSM